MARIGGRYILLRQVPLELHGEAKVAAFKAGLSLAEWIQRAMKDKLDQACAPMLAGTAEVVSCGSKKA
jgi:hypothetical protein